MARIYYDKDTNLRSIRSKNWRCSATARKAMRMRSTYVTALSLFVCPCNRAAARSRRPKPTGLKS